MRIELPFQQVARNAKNLIFALPPRNQIKRFVWVPHDHLERTRRPTRWWLVVPDRYVERFELSLVAAPGVNAPIEKMLLPSFIARYGLEAGAAA